MDQQWYSNKDLFEKIQKLSEELQETRQVVVRYNNLVEKLHKNELKTEQISEDVKGLSEIIAGLRYERQGKASAFEMLRNWTPWIITIFTILSAYVTK